MFSKVFKKNILNIIKMIKKKKYLENKEFIHLKNKINLYNNSVFFSKFY